MNFTEFFTNKLNQSQQKAVSPHSGILLVTAGAGSGKTRVITARMAYLINNHGVPASQILALTFTNKAAREMRERTGQFLGEQGPIPFVGTFHSYCLRTLKSNRHLLPFPTFSLMDEQDQEKIARKLIADKNLTKKLRPGQLLGYISRLKNEATSDKERATMWGDDLLYRDLYYLYEKQKNDAHCLDFDDLLLLTLDLFRKNEAFKASFQKLIRHVLVDEYQDTNKVQHALLTEMATHNDQFNLDSLCVVGDEDQSIYSWRGATVRNIINFKSDFPSAEGITIEQNYRSVQPILHIANHVITNNQFRNPKNLFSERQANDAIRIITTASSYQEGEAVAHCVKQLRMQSQGSSIGLLYRSHFQSRSIEEALIRHSIPYTIVGGIQFYDRLEIKDLLAYMRLIVNPFDRLAFSRIINKPLRGLGDKFEELFLETWEMMPFESYHEVANKLLDHAAVTGTKAQALRQFLTVFTELHAQERPTVVLMKLLERTGYYTYLDGAFDKDEALTKKENLKELLNGMLYFEEQHEPTLDAFLQEVSLLQEQITNSTESEDHIKLMTFHAAKGLEFNTVILAGIEEGILPSSRSLFNPEALEEERRLLYVGITRAKDRLLITRSKYRYTYGQLSDQQPSQFLSEIPAEYAPESDVSYFRDYDFDDYFMQWITGKRSTASRYIKPQTNDISYENDFSDEEEAPWRNFTSSSTKQLSQLTPWKRYQSVVHATFGQGVIEKVEQKETGTHLTIRFRSGIKKLDASFVAPL